MAWIESHESLPSHPKTKRMCRNLKISPVVAVGHLHFLWWWSMNHAQDGVLDKYTADDIADACGWEGDSEVFFNSLVSSGFVDRTQEGHSIHDWYRYAGKLIALRQKDAERKRNSRGKGVTSDGHPEDIQRTSYGNPPESIRDLNPNPNLNQNNINNKQYADTVFMTEEQYEKLKSDFPNEDVDLWIDKLDEWQTNNPKKKKKDHNKTIRTWIRTEEKKRAAIQVVKPFRKGSDPILEERIRLQRENENRNEYSDAVNL